MVPLDRRTLFQCVVLSLLLHVWVVVLFGTATYGGARRDRDFGDALNVSLRALTQELGTTFRLAPGSETASPGTALLPHTGVAPPSPQRRDTGRPPSAAAAREPSAASVRGGVPPAPEPAPPPVTAPPPIAPPAAEPLPRLNLDAPDEVAKPYAPAVPPPPSVEPEVAPPVPIVPREMVPLPSPERVVPPQPPPLERESVTPAETKPRETPSPPAAVERLPPPAIEREVAPAAEPTPRVVPIVPSTPIEPIPAPKSEAEPAPPVTAPPPRIAPSEPVARPEPVTPTVQRDVAPAAAPPAPASAPAPRSVPSEVAPRPAERSAPGRSPTTQITPPTEAAPTESPPRLRFGAPEPGEGMFKPRGDVVTPSIEPGTAPYLDLDDAKKRAVRAIVREGSGSRGLLPVVPPPPERDSKEARALEKAIKPDCRTAYANMGLLAAVPLVASAIGDGGCRW